MVQKDDRKNYKDTQVTEDAKELPELRSQMASRKCLRIQSNGATLCNEACQSLATSNGNTTSVDIDIQEIEAVALEDSMHSKSPVISFIELCP